LYQATCSKWHRWHMLHVNSRYWLAHQPGLAVDRLRWASDLQVGADPSTSHTHLACEGWHLVGSLPGSGAVFVAAWTSCNVAAAPVTDKQSSLGTMSGFHQRMHHCYLFCCSTYSSSECMLSRSWLDRIASGITCTSSSVRLAASCSNT